MDASPPTMLSLHVNGKRHALPPDALASHTTLLSYLRTHLHLTGTKLGCGEGGCGACTVLVSTYNKTTNQVAHAALNACLTPLLSCVDKHVTTIEGVGGAESESPSPSPSSSPSPSPSPCPK